MKCAAIREDFLSAITEPAKCMEIKQNKDQTGYNPAKKHTHTLESRKELEIQKR